VISVESKWKVIAPDGSIHDQADEHFESIADRPNLRLQILLGQAVTRTQLHPPKSISLHFSGGYELRLYDSSENFESFHIYPDEIHI